MAEKDSFYGELNSRFRGDRRELITPDEAVLLAFPQSQACKDLVFLGKSYIEEGLRKDFEGSDGGAAPTGTGDLLNFYPPYWLDERMHKPIDPVSTALIHDHSTSDYAVLMRIPGMDGHTLRLGAIAEAMDKLQQPAIHLDETANIRLCYPREILDTSFKLRIGDKNQYVPDRFTSQLRIQFIYEQVKHAAGNGAYEDSYYDQPFAIEWDFGLGGRFAMRRVTNVNSTLPQRTKIFLSHTSFLHDGGNPHMARHAMTVQHHIGETITPLREAFRRTQKDQEASVLIPGYTNGGK